jgi:uncharacterized surface protein with fasciclin (FAS1) repeats
VRKDILQSSTRVIATGSLALLLAACGGSDDNENLDFTNGLLEPANTANAEERALPENGAEQEQAATVVAAAVADGRFTTLVAALQATGLDAVLSSPEGTFTVFAPTDEAFGLLPEGTLETLLSAEGLETLADILLYHVIADLPEAVAADTAVSLAQLGEPSNQVVTANGDNITLSIGETSGALFINDAQVIITDIITDNGIIHVLDAVLSPPQEMISMDSEAETPAEIPAEELAALEPEAPSVICDPENADFQRSLFQAISEEPDLTTLTAVLELTELNQVLRNVFNDTDYTVFAPTDAAFGKFLNTLDPVVLEQFTLSGVDSLEDTVGIEALTDILLYHVLSIPADFDTALAIAGNDVITDRVVETLNGDGIQLSTPDDTRLFVNTSEVVCADFISKNGLFHKVDTVVQLPQDVDVVHLAALKPNLSTFYRLVKLVDLDHLLRASQELTILAPTNEAFDELDPDTLAFLESDEGREDLIHILSQHVIIQQPEVGDVRIPFATALTADGLKLRTAAEGVQLTVSVQQENVNIGGADVIDPDNQAANGVIHVIDSVIVSPPQS